MPAPYDSFQIKKNNACLLNNNLSEATPCNPFSSLDRSQTFRTAPLGNLAYIVTNDNKTQCLQKNNTMDNISASECQVFNPYTSNPGFSPYVFNVPREISDPKAFEPYDNRTDSRLARDYTPDGKVDYSKIVNQPLITKVEYKDLSTTPFLSNVAIGTLL